MLRVILLKKHTALLSPTHVGEHHRVVNTVRQWRTQQPVQNRIPADRFRLLAIQHPSTRCDVVICSTPAPMRKGGLALSARCNTGSTTTAMFTFAKKGQHGSRECRINSADGWMGATYSVTLAQQSSIQRHSLCGDPPQQRKPTMVCTYTYRCQQNTFRAALHSRDRQALLHPCRPRGRCQGQRLCPPSSGACQLCHPP